MDCPSRSSRSGGGQRHQHLMARRGQSWRAEGGGSLPPFSPVPASPTLPAFLSPGPDLTLLYLPLLPCPTLLYPLTDRTGASRLPAELTS